MSAVMVCARIGALIAATTLLACASDGNDGSDRSGRDAAEGIGLFLQILFALAGR
jgi:hypothetical protein